MQGYCLKCKAMREIRDAKSVTLNTGRPAIQGYCLVCGGKMSRIGKA